ncbi:MAG: glycosyltransferase [Lachnospiraceae bacterium]|nr:glycosyltransferase [Lachnospiraceae bacterium]
MKKILLMVPMLHQGGFERVCIKTAKLLQASCQVAILIFDDADIAFDTSGLEVINLDMGSTDQPLKKAWNVYRRVRKVRQIKKEKQIDICYSFGLTANLVNALSRAQEQVWVGLRGFLDLESKVYPIFARRADKIICCAKMIERQVHRDYPEKDAVTIYNSFDFSRIEVLTSEERMESAMSETEKAFYEGKKVVISAGRDDDIKGFWHLLRSFSALAAKVPEARLVIMGEGEFASDRAFAKMLGIEDKVLFTGVRTNPFAYMKHANVYALTSLSEGFPNGLVEAMALPLPVIAANCPSGPAEILMGHAIDVVDTHKVYDGGYGILIPEFSSVKEVSKRELEPEEEILEQQLYRLLTDEQLSQRYAERGLKRAREFSEENYLRELLKNMEPEVKC